MCPTGSNVPSVLHARKRPNAISQISCHHHHNNLFFFFFFLFKPAISLLEPIEALIFPLNVSTEDGGVHQTSSIGFLYAVRHNGIRHALPGEKVNDAIFLDSSNAQCKKLVHVHFPTHERRWGWYICLCIIVHVLQ